VFFGDGIFGRFAASSPSIILCSAAAAAAAADNVYYLIPDTECATIPTLIYMNTQLRPDIYSPSALRAAAHSHLSSAA